MNDIGDALKLLIDLDDKDLANVIYGLQNVKAIKSTQNQDPQVELTDELPCINIPSEYLLPAIEYLFMVFLKELGNNFKEDYKTKIFNTLTNNKSLIVSSYFDRTMSSEGQYPRAVVKCENLSYTPEFIGNVPEQALSSFGGSTYGANEGASMQCTVRIDIIDETYPATNILASIVTHNLAANLSNLRSVYNLQQITYPSLTGAQRIREYGDLYMATITFTCKKQVRWHEKYTLKEYTNIIRRLTAYGNGDPNAVEDIYSQIIQVSACRGLPLSDSIVTSIENRPRL